MILGRLPYVCTLLLSLISMTSLAFPSSDPPRKLLSPSVETEEPHELDEPDEPDDRTSPNKYFHEPGQDDILGHYDTRFFNSALTYDEKYDTQYHMARAYLSTFRELGLETWIAHGTLLGWWWNGKMLPWDWDIDTQISHHTLHYLARHFNGSTHRYHSPEHDVTRHYLLDINPWAIIERERGDGANIIDARWIDVRNGLYIDITGLSETHPVSEPKIWSCKNYHRYAEDELWPMRESVFEGVSALIPYSYASMLSEEYGSEALVVTEFEGHRWNPTTKEWIKYQSEE